MQNISFIAPLSCRIKTTNNKTHYP